MNCLQLATSRNYDALGVQMIKKYYVFLMVSLLLIPAVTMLGAIVSILINPEIAVHYANYERNFRILNHLKTCFLLSALAVDIGLWVLAYFFLLKSKKQSCDWHRAECGHSPKAWKPWRWRFFAT